ncbi:MerR family transcriptional regulator [Pontibacillus litoralis JSM 072002]|uniref:MerR family transcriptional regulator n=1 Tax=Pontibacillus litoralis JSM 072002 TaxID=1385512 RepID=A0A0A5FYH7_9BACI|nr:MerR family transcriptional regulator [Pontibacillus litoralis JSM 072002]
MSVLTKKFDVSPRTIRYYEQLGMITPHRTETGQRIYGKKEMTRLVLIFRGKKFGFKLDEIKEMVQLFDQDPSGTKQLERTIRYGEEKVKEVTEKIEELIEMRREMEEMLQQFREKLRNQKEE